MNSGTEVRRTSFLHHDQELGGRIKHDLETSGYASLKQVRVIVAQGEVFLGGCVPTWFMKQVAQTRVLALEGVHRVNNELIVAGE